MATQVQFRGGTTTEHASFDGAAREVTVDTTKQTLVVQDGSTDGGFPLLRENLSNLPAGTIDNADVNASAAIAGTKIAPDFGSQNIVTTGDFTVGPTTHGSPTSFSNICLGGTGHLYAETTGGAGNSLSVSQNAHIDADGSWEYIVTDEASNMWMNAGNIGFRVANVGTAGNDITWEDGLIMKKDNTVEIYYNGSKKFQTESYGLQVFGNLFIADGGSGSGENRIDIGNGSDLKIYHENSSTTNWIEATNGDVKIQCADGDIYLNPKAGEVGVKVVTDGAAELHWGGTNPGKKFETTEKGGKLTSTTSECNLQFTNDARTWKIVNFDYGNNGSDHIGFHDGTADRFLIRMDGHIEVPTDGGKLLLGADEDLQLYHDGSNAYLDNGTGNFQIVTPNDHNTQWNANGQCSVYGNQDSNFIFIAHNDGNGTSRYGMRIISGADNAAGVNTALQFADGNGTTQGQIDFTDGTVTYGPFTAHHPCIVPDSDNPSDDSNAYPYGTLLEIISIEYTQRNGADTERGIIYKVQKTQSANSKKVLGAYGGSRNGGADNHTNQHQASILGDGHILVNNAGGNIEVGDGICSSSTVGIGQKATVNPSMIIGIAQEAITFTGSETKLVTVQYGLQQFIPWT